jgi:hypothetical protein
MVLFAVVTLLLGGCGDSDETKAKHLLTQAETLMQQNNQLQSEQILNDLVATYPKTPPGQTARMHLQRIQKERELQESRGVLVKILASYQQVIDGYYALYAEYPRSFAALDQSDYFFDSTYLEEVTPDGYKVYLWLNSDGSSYRVWCVAQKPGFGLAVETQNRKPIPFAHDDTLEKIKASFQAVAWDDKLVALQDKK